MYARKITLILSDGSKAYNVMIDDCDDTVNIPCISEIAADQLIECLQYGTFVRIQEGRL